MKIWEQEACEIRHEHIDHSMMCAGGVKNRDACGGDSGGPVIAKNNGKDVLVGIVSWGADECGEEGVPGVYARVTHALNFIYFHIPSLANTTSTP
jgi:secreted trypsin-like serine protease